MHNIMLWKHMFSIISRIKGTKIIIAPCSLSPFTVIINLMFLTQFTRAERVNPTILRCKVNWILNLLTALFLPYIKTLLKNTTGSPRLFKGYSDTDKCKRREGIYNWQHSDISIRYVFPSSSRFEAHIYLAMCKTSSFQLHFFLHPHGLEVSGGKG